MEVQSGLKFEVCKKCHGLIRYQNTDTYWDESGYGYSVKLVDCPGCGTPTVLKYEEDSWIKELELN